MDLNLNKIDEDLKDSKNPARRLSGTGAKGQAPVTSETEKLDDIAIAEAVAQVEAEIKSEEKQLPDYFLFNLAFAVVVVAFWLKYLKMI